MMVVFLSFTISSNRISLARITIVVKSAHRRIGSYAPTLLPPASAPVPRIFALLPCLSGFVEPERRSGGFVGSMGAPLLEHEKVWEEIEKPVQISVNLAREHITDWQYVRSRNRFDGHRPQLESPLTWSKPPEGTVKCNIDAAIFDDENRFGNGICVRNAAGEFVCAARSSFEGIPRAIEAEAAALQFALDWLLGKGFGKVEMDCKAALLKCPKNVKQQQLH